MKVRFLPSGEEHEIQFNETVLHLAQRCGIHIQSVCKGMPSCAECRVQMVEGEHHVLPPSKKELDLIGTAHYVDLSRLSCQLRCFGDVTVDLSEQIEKEKRTRQGPVDRSVRSDGQKSRAVLGGIFDNLNPDMGSEPGVHPSKKEGETGKKEKKSVQSSSGLDRKNTFYGDFYRTKKKSNPSGNRNPKRRGKKRKTNFNKKQG